MIFCGGDMVRRHARRINHRGYKYLRLFSPRNMAVYICTARLIACRSYISVGESEKMVRVNVRDGGAITLPGE